MEAVFVVKTADKEGNPIAGVFKKINQGYATIGWSYEEKLDLRKLKQKLDDGQDLEDDEKDAKRCLGFLTRVNVGDYLLYPNQPERGKFLTVKVVGEYDYSDGGDFRSFRPCEVIAKPVDVWDEIVPSKLRHRLGRPGRFSEVYDHAPLHEFLDRIEKAGKIPDNTDMHKAAVKRIHEKIRQTLPIEIQREFSRQDLSRILCGDLFERMGHAPLIQEGPAEAGSDIVVTVDDPLLPEIRVGVQVFSYEGDVEKAEIEKKLNQLLKGWQVNDLNYGVLLTTGYCTNVAKESLRCHNGKNPDRQVRLIDGGTLADLFIRYYPPNE